MFIAPFRLERYYATREFTAPVTLSSSDCETMSVGELLALDPEPGASLYDLRLGYTQSAGSPALRSLIAHQYSRIRPDGVLVHTGAQEAVFTLMAGLLEPGDHVIVHAPAYQSLAEVARMRGCEVTPWRTDADHDWALDVEFLADSIRPNTRLIVVNCPHSPTGYLMSRQTQAEITGIARHHGIVVFSDEVYRGLEYDTRNRLPAMCDVYEHGVSLGVLSKAYGLAGLRIGWLATQDHALLDRAAVVKDYTTICSSGPSEHLACAALRASDRILERNGAIVRANLSLWDDFVAAQEEVIDVVRPLAGPVAFPRIPQRPDVDAFCAEVLDRAGVLLLPGTVFDEHSDAFRVGLGRLNFPAALDRFRWYLEQTLRGRVRATLRLEPARQPVPPV